jgi:hypothetical protein
MMEVREKAECKAKHMLFGLQINFVETYKLVKEVYSPNFVCNWIEATRVNDFQQNTMSFNEY